MPARTGSRRPHASIYQSESLAARGDAQTLRKRSARRRERDSREGRGTRHPGRDRTPDCQHADRRHHRRRGSDGDRPRDGVRHLGQRSPGDHRFGADGLRVCTRPLLSRRLDRVRQGGRTLASTLPVRPAGRSRVGHRHRGRDLIPRRDSAFRGFRRPAHAALSSRPPRRPVANRQPRPRRRVHRRGPAAGAVVLGPRVAGAQRAGERASSRLRAGSPAATSPPRSRPRGTTSSRRSGEEFNNMSDQFDDGSTSFRRSVPGYARRSSGSARCLPSNLDRQALLELALKTAIDAVEGERRTGQRALDDNEPLAEAAREGSLDGSEDDDPTKPSAAALVTALSARHAADGPRCCRGAGSARSPVGDARPDDRRAPGRSHSPTMTAPC